MKKILPVFIFVLFIIFSSTLLAAPNGVMTLGSISKTFPENELRQFWQKAWPEMVKIHGPAYSFFTFSIETRPDLAEHEGGWDPINKQVIYDEKPLRDYQELFKQNPQGAINSLKKVHEEAHAMYTYGDKVMKFPFPWINEGWAKTTEDITVMRVQNDPPRPGLYLSLLMDKDTVGGTESFGKAKQRRNMSVVYDPVTVASLNLLYGCSSSNIDPDFQKNMDQVIFDEYVVKNKLDQFSKLPFPEYQKIIKNLCGDKKIDDENASTWYFANPSSNIKGSLGFHIGITPHWWAYTTVEGLDIYTFNRVKNTLDQDLSEKGVGSSVKVEIFDSKENLVYTKEGQTDNDGNLFLNFGRDFLKNGSYFVVTSANYQDKNYNFKMPFISIRDLDGTGEDQQKAEMAKANEVIGIMVNKNLAPLSSQYLALLKPLGSAKIIANSNGLFIANVPNVETKEITFEFLGQTFTFTKPPFRRVVTLKVSGELIKKAQGQSDFKNFKDEGSQINENNKENSNPLSKNPKALNWQKLLIAFALAIAVSGALLGAYFLINKKFKKPTPEIPENKEDSKERGDKL